MIRLKELRDEAGLSQGDIAEKFSVAQNTVSSWENGKRDPDTDTVKKIAAFFGVSIDYLLGVTSIKKAPSLEDAELSTEESELLRRFRKVSPALQDAALRMLETDQKKENP